METAIVAFLVLGAPLALTAMLWFGVWRLGLAKLMRIAVPGLAPALWGLAAYTLSGSTNSDGDEYPAVTAVIIVWLLVSGSLVLFLEAKWVGPA